MNSNEWKEEAEKKIRQEFLNIEFPKKNNNCVAYFRRLLFATFH